MKYIIISPEKSTDKEVVFWGPDRSGYTSIPWAAGFYNEDEVVAHPDYFNDGFKAVAIPLTAKALETIGLSCTINLKSLDNFLQRS